MSQPLSQPLSQLEPKNLFYDPDSSYSMYERDELNHLRNEMDESNIKLKETVDVASRKSSTPPSIHDVNSVRKSPTPPSIHEVQSPTATENVFLCIPDSSEKDNLEEEEEEVVIVPHEENNIAFMNFSIPIDVSSSIDEMETLINVCKKTILKPTKNNPNPTVWDNLNKMLINLVYALAGSTVSQENERMTGQSFQICLAQQAEHIVSNLCTKQKFIDGFLKYVYPTLHRTVFTPGLPFSCKCGRRKSLTRSTVRERHFKTGIKVVWQSLLTKKRCTLGGATT